LRGEEIEVAADAGADGSHKANREGPYGPAQRSHVDDFALGVANDRAQQAQQRDDRTAVQKNAGAKNEERIILSELNRVSL